MKDNETNITEPDYDDGKLEARGMKTKSGILEWFDNFFYHYKWHTIVALIAIFAIVVCTVQMCSKTSYDLYIMYAGSDSISTAASESDSSEYEKLVSAMKQYTPDFNEDGESHVNILNLYIPSNKAVEDMANDVDQLTLNRILSDRETFRENIYYGSYQICFIADHLLLEYTKEGMLSPFADITPYIPEGKSYETLNGCGVYLRSTPLYEKAGFNLMAEDTVICIRKLSEVSTTFFRGDENKENFRRSEEVLRNLLK